MWFWRRLSKKISPYLNVLYNLLLMEFFWIKKQTSELFLPKSILLCILFEIFECFKNTNCTRLWFSGVPNFHLNSFHFFKETHQWISSMEFIRHNKLLIIFLLFGWCFYYRLLGFTYSYQWNEKIISIYFFSELQLLCIHFNM